MHSGQICPSCGSLMDYRLGNYDCSRCGHQQAAAPENPAEDASKQLARQNLDPTAAYKQLTAKPSEVAQVAAYDPNSYRKGPRARGDGRDPLRDEKLLFSVVNLLASGGNAYYLLATDPGEVLMHLVLDRSPLPGIRDLQVIVIFCTALYVLMTAAALLFGPRWMRAMMFFVALLLALGVIAGIVVPALNVHDLVFTLPGFLVLIPAAWLLILTGRDLTGEVV